MVDATWMAGVAIAYFLAAKLGLTLATVGVTVTLVWPPSGVFIIAQPPSLAGRGARGISRERDDRCADRSARQEAEAASTAKSDFLAVMSHELRTPLNAIIGYVALLADGITGPLNERQLAQLNRVKASAAHLLQLIERILSLSRIEARRDDVRLESVDARTIVAEAAELFDPLMTTKGLALELDLPAEPTLVETDVTKMRQILLNLLTNAVKFTDRGTVRCHLRSDAHAIVVDVSDTGRGIVADDLQHVFEVFWQGGSVERERPEGVGLGLSVSRQLARLLGGDITVVSVQGQGSTFSLRLPRHAPNDGEPRHVGATSG